MKQAFLEVEVKPGNPKYRVPNSNYSFSGKVVACLSVTIHDADNQHIYVRFNDHKDMYEFMNGTIEVEGLVDVKKIWNHLPTDNQSPMHVPELVISKSKGVKKMTFIKNQMEMMSGYHSSFHQLMNQQSRLQDEFNQRYRAGIDPYQMSSPINKDCKPIKKHQKVLLLM